MLLFPVKSLQRSRWAAFNLTCWELTSLNNRGCGTGWNEKGLKVPKQYNGLLLSSETARVCGKVYSQALLFIIIIITVNHLHCFSVALTVSAGSYFTVPDHQPHQLSVALATVVSFSSPSFPIGIGPPAVTCRKISTPVHSHTQMLWKIHKHWAKGRWIYTQGAHSNRATLKHTTWNIILCTSQRIRRQSFTEFKDTQLYSTSFSASYSCRHLQCKTSKLSSSLAHSLSLEPLKLLEVLELLLFIFVIKQSIILWLGFSNLPTETISIFLRYPVTCSTFCFALWQNMFNLTRPINE